MYRIVLCVVGLVALALSGLLDRQSPIDWNEQELARINSLRLPNQIQTLQIHTGNQYWNNSSAQTLGQQLFFDKRLSKDASIACANCHQPENGFADPSPLSSGIGTTKRHSPSLLGAAASPWQFWDGRADSLWSQALGPLEDPNEHGANRLQLAHLIKANYAIAYNEIFQQLPELENLPKHATPAGSNTQWQQNWQSLTKLQQNNINRVFANIGKAIAAYQSQLIPSESKFDLFASELLSKGTSDILTRKEQQGLKLFIDDSRSQCMRCHNGPLFTNSDFQVTGIKDTSSPIGLGRIEGIQTAISSEFSCTGPYSDATNHASECAELNYAKRKGAELHYAFKVPSLRNISKTAPYMHNGSMENLADVLHFYASAKTQYPLETKNSTEKNLEQEPLNTEPLNTEPLNTESLNTELLNKNKPTNAHLDIEPLPLASNQLKQIEAFLMSLDSIQPIDKKITSPIISE